MSLWYNQWELFAPNFREGKAHIELPSCVLQLAPGPGFGDFSHPTTRLILKMMEERCKNRTVLDIGCGSGILSLAAAGFGALKVVGIDIDPEAVAHAQTNLRLNPLCANVSFQNCLDSDFCPDLICMNMIPAEQQEAWKSLPQLHVLEAVILTSGVLEDSACSYLAWAKSQGWSATSHFVEEGWMSFIF